MSTQVRFGICFCLLALDQNHHPKGFLQFMEMVMTELGKQHSVSQHEVAHISQTS